MWASGISVNNGSKTLVSSPDAGFAQEFAVREIHADLFFSWNWDMCVIDCFVWFLHVDCDSYVARVFWCEHNIRDPWCRASMFFDYSILLHSGDFILEPFA